WHRVHRARRTGREEVMSEQNTLTTYQIRNLLRDDQQAEFEAWLAEHDAKVRAEALRDAAAWVEETAAHDGLMYREFDDGYEVADSIPTALRVRADREQG